MEAAGLAIGVVGLAALVSSCKQMMDQIDSFRHVGSEARPILAEFSASKLIFDRWLQNVDVSGDAVKTADGKPVDEKTAHVLQDLISCIRESLKSIEVVVSDFSTSPAEFTQSGDKPALKERPTDLSTKTKFQWAFSRKEKAIKEVQNFYRLIQKLHALIPVSGPSGDTPYKHASTRDPVDELAAHLDKLSERNKADTRRSIDQWLGAKSTESYYEDRLRERQDETCSWIFDRPAFVSWISPEFPDDSAKLLWLHAPPGFGKTILCARIIESLRSSSPDTTAQYFFSERQNDPYAILRSWISQVVYQHDGALKTAIQYPRVEMTATAAHSDLEQLFRSILQANPGLTFVVDGLDECEDANGRSHDVTDSNRFQFLKALRQLISDSKTRILVVSRDSLDIRSALHPEQVEDRATILEVVISKHDVEEDLKSFSKTIVSQKLANRTEDLRTELADQMAERADGMFLWVKLHQSGLRGSKTKKRLQEIISSMPQGLQRTYDKNVDRIKSLESTDRSRAFFILRWLMIDLGMPTVGQIAVGFAVRMSGQGPALQCDELPESVDQNYIDEEILSTCADLVEVKAERPDQPHQYRVLSFIHSSIREYMLQVVPEDTPAISFSDKSFQREVMCDIFLRFLNYDTTWERSSRTTELSQQLFFLVAANFWMYQITGEEIRFEGLSKSLHTFFSPNNLNWDKWQDAFRDGWLERGMLWINDPIQCTWERLIMHIIRYSPLRELISECYYRVEDSELAEMSKLSNQMWRDMTDSTPELADILKQLEPLTSSPRFSEFRRRHSFLGKMAPFHGMGADSGPPDDLANGLCQPSTKLHCAAAINHVDLLRDILEAEPESIDIIGGPYGSALQVACASGFQRIADELITRGADVNQKSGISGCAMNAAALNGNQLLIKKLFDAGAKLDILDPLGRDALLRAISESHQNAVIELLNLEARVDIRYEWSTLGATWEMTALLYCAQSGQTEIFELLLEKGADIYAVDNDGENCLHLAALWGATSSVEMILNISGDKLLNALDAYGCAPISAAISSKYPEIFHRLLSFGAKVNITNVLGQTLLHLAVQSNQRGIVQTLLGLELDANCQDSNGVMPFTLAVFLGHNDICRDLLNHGADVERAAVYQISSLHTATRKNNAEMVQEILDKTANLLEAKDSGFQTPLNWAVNFECVHVARLLLERGADVNTRDSGGKTPLHMAARSANTEMMEVLLGHGAEISTEDDIGCTPILDAAVAGQLGNYKTLLQHGADEKKTGNSGESVIHLAASSGSIEMIQFLIDRGWDVNETNKNMQTSVHYAIWEGKSEALAFLLDHGGDTTRIDDSGRSLVHCAASVGQSDYLRLLFDRDLAGDMKCRDYTGHTPLQRAAWFGHIDVVELILDRVAGIIDHCSKNGRTPLSLATFKGHTLVMEALIEKGADTTVLPLGWKTLLQVAQAGGHIEAVKVLLRELQRQTDVSESRSNFSGGYRTGRSRSLSTSVQRQVVTKERAKRSLSR